MLSKTTVQKILFKEVYQPEKFIVEKNHYSPWWPLTSYQKIITRNYHTIRRRSAAVSAK